LEPSEPWDEPACQQAARATEDEGGLADIAAEFHADPAQAVERLATGIAQANPGICEFDAAPILDEQGHAQVLLEHLDLPTDSPMGDMQRFGRQADAVQPGSRLEGSQGIEGRKVLAHDV